jgi:hypothetical protein
MVTAKRLTEMHPPSGASGMVITSKDDATMAKVGLDEPHLSPKDVTTYESMPTDTRAGPVHENSISSSRLKFAEPILMAATAASASKNNKSILYRRRMVFGEESV